MKREREDENEVAVNDRRAKGLKMVPLPAEILALPHVVTSIEEFAMSFEEAAMKAAATGQADWLENLLPYSSNYDVILEIGAAHGHCAVIEAVYDWGRFCDDDHKPSCKALTNAIRGGHVDALHCLLPKYDRDLRVALVEAVKVEHQVVIEIVAEAACRNSADHKEMFEWAVGEGVLEVVKRLRDSQQEHTLLEALATAARRGHLDIVKFLHEDNLYAGDDIGPSYIVGTPIVVAARNGHLDIVNFLFDNEGYVTRAELDKAFTEAATWGHLQVVQFFLAHEVNQPSLIKNAINYAAGNGCLEVVKFLHSGGYRYSPHDAIMQAAAGSHLEVVAFLFDNGASQISLRDNALVKAAARGHLEVVAFLLDNGANQISLLNEAFMGAVAGGCLEVMKFLYDNGGRAVDEGRLGVVAKGHVEIVKRVCNNEDDRTALLNDAFSNAASSDDLNAVKFLFANGVNQASLLDEAFIKAATRGHLKIVKFLVDKRTSQPILDDAVEQAASLGHLGIVKFLCRSEVTQSSLDDAFVKAATNCHFKVMRFLADNGNIQIPLLDKALIAATARGHYHVVEFLLRHGGGNRTSLLDHAFVTAAAIGHRGLTKILYSHGGGHDDSLLAKAIAAAASKGHIKVLIYLLSRQRARRRLMKRLQRRQLMAQ